MRPLTAQELLELWESCHGQAPAERALALLAGVYPEASWDALAALSIGQRDARLLALRERLWGPQMTALVICPDCGEQLELNLDTRVMLSYSQQDQPGEISLSIADFTMIIRLPTSLDVLAVAAHADPETGGSLILQRCLLSAQQAGAPVNAAQLPPAVVEGLAQRMAEADPLADIQLDVACPTCAHRWRAAFDIVSFLWREIEAWARRMLNDVHTLAAAYGWCERDILDLGPMRRQFYLEMASA
jgi:hypothetical protein